MMKRSVEDREVEALAMANCLMLLAKLGNNPRITSSDRVFECKTCNKSFNSFQALGGHKASHNKKPRLLLMDNAGDVSGKVTVLKPKIHECSICGQEFPMGQALGGHMRRHRAAPPATLDLITSNFHMPPTKKVIPVLKRCNSKRILLDLNLTPYENELELEKIAPAWLH